MAASAALTPVSKLDEEPLILLASSATLGHVAPLCVVAADFVERGYDTIVLIASCFRSQVAKSGAKFISFSGKA
jgi:UDP:flavonoid glycosyltransferase YjiC (YdhE family)